MEVYSTEEEQVEAIQRWWKQNGRAVLTGLALVLLAVVGWRWWVEHQQNRAEAASAEFQQMISLLESDPDRAVELGRGIVGEHPTSAYAAFASLAMARVAMGAGDLEQAEVHLRRVMSTIDEPELKELARLRLARVLLARGEAEQALQVGTGESQAYGALFAELRGDIYLAMDRRADARQAFEEALEGYGAPDKQRIVQMKLDDLADARSEAK